MKTYYYELSYLGGWLADYSDRKAAIGAANDLRANGRRGDVTEWTWNRHTRQWVARQLAF